MPVPSRRGPDQPGPVFGHFQMVPQRQYLGSTEWRARMLTFPRVYVSGISAAASIVLLLAGPSNEWLAVVFVLGLVTVASAILPRTRVETFQLSIVSALPVSFIALVFSAVVVLQFILPFGETFISRGFALLVWSGFMIGACVASFLRGGEVPLVGDDLAAALAALLVAGLGALVVILQPFEVWSRAVGRSTDFNRHLLLVKQVVTDGGLNYAETAYPLGIHGVFAVMWSAVGGESYAGAWRGVEAMLWMLIVLLVLAIVATTSRLMRMLCVQGWIFSVLSVAMTLVIFLQSMWITSFFRLGFVTSLAAGLVLAAVLLLATGSRGWFGTAESTVWLAIATAVVSHTWTLFVPTIGGLLLLAIAIGWKTDGWGILRKRRWQVALAFVAFAALSTVQLFVALVQSRAIDADISEGLAASGASGLAMPERWWIAALGLSLLSITLLLFSPNRRVGLLLATMLFIGAVTVAFIASRGGGPLSELNYYALKTMWSFTVIVIPLALVGSIWLLYRATTLVQHMDPGIPRLLATTGVAVIMTALVAGVAGRTAGTPSFLLSAVRDGFGPVSAQIATVTELENRSIDVEKADERGVLLWGIFPNSSPAFAASYSNALGDRLAMESTAWVGTDVFDQSVALAAVYFRRTDDACRYLQQHPDALRITGPNADAGATWLIDAGCPESVVAPEEWISVEIDPAWFTGTEMSRMPYVYPTYKEFQDFQEQQMKRTPQEEPQPSSPNPLG